MISRDFRPEDAPALRRVFYEAVHGLAAGAYTPAQRQAWAPLEHDPEAWASRMEKLAPIVMESDGIIIGYADLQPDGYIDHFFVAPQAARQGVGSRLMSCLKARATILELTRLYAHVSLNARPFFERHDFRVVTLREVEVKGITMHNYLMECC